MQTLPLFTFLCLLTGQTVIEFMNYTVMTNGIVAIGHPPKSFLRKIQGLEI